jgi:hypothetical protein
MPLYGRAQTLAGRATGLLQLRSKLGNPFLEGLENFRTFSNLDELIQKTSVLLELEEELFWDQETQIRILYAKIMEDHRKSYSETITSRLGTKAL